MEENYGARYPSLMKASVLVCGATFILVFPLTIIVKLYAAFGIFPLESSFNGLRNVALAVAGLVCGLNIILNNSSLLRLSSFSLYLLLVGYIGVILVLNFDLNGYVGDSYQSTGDYHNMLYVKYILFCVLGTHLYLLTQARHVLLIFTLAASVVILSFVDLETYRINVAEFTEEANRGNYQAIGDALAISSLLVVAMYPSTVFRFVFALAISAVLFLVGSRTSFAVFGFAMILYMLISFGILRIASLAIILFALSVVYVSSIDWADIEARNPRMVKIFTDYENDGSIQGRKERDQIGWEDISNNPVLGNFGGQREFGGWAAYMHNFFSYWRQFGVFPFLMLNILYATFFYLCFKKFKKRLTSYYAIPFLIGTFQVIESVLSRSFAFSNTHLFFGLLISFHGWSSYGTALGRQKMKPGTREVSGGSTGRRRRRRRRKGQLNSV